MVQPSKDTNFSQNTYFCLIAAASRHWLRRIFDLRGETEPATRQAKWKQSREVV